MAKGRRQKGYKRVFPGEIESRIVEGKLEKNDLLAPIDKVRAVAVRTVAKPNCDQTIQAKKVTVNVKGPKASVRKKTISSKPGDGTKGVNFRTKGAKPKARKVDMRNGDGTHGVNFHKQEIQEKP